MIDDFLDDLELLYSILFSRKFASFGRQQQLNEWR